MTCTLKKIDITSVCLFIYLSFANLIIKIISCFIQVCNFPTILRCLFI